MARIRLVLFVLVVGLLVSGYVAGTHMLREKLENSLQQAFQRPVRIGKVHLTFPAGVVLKEISLSSSPGQPGTLSAAQAVARFGILSLLKGRPGIDLELAGLTLSTSWDAQHSFLRPLTGLPEAGRKPVLPPVNRLRVRDGQATIVDRTVSPEVTWVLKDLSVSVRRVGGGQHQFSALGALAGSEGRPAGKFDLSGHCVPGRTADVKVVVQHTQIGLLAPYIRPALATAPVQGACAVTSKVSVKDGDLTADTDLSATGVVFPTDEPTTLGPPGNQLFELLKDKQGTMHLVFVVRGSLSEKLHWSERMAVTLREAMQGALAKSIQSGLTETEQIKPVEESVRRGMDSLGR